MLDRLRKIKDDESFVKAIMLFAWNADCFQELTDAIDAEELQEEQDFYQLIQLVYEEDCKQSNSSI